MAKNNNLQDYLKDLYAGILLKKPNASKNPQDFRTEIESIKAGPNYDGGIVDGEYPEVDSTGYPKLLAVTTIDGVADTYTLDNEDGYYKAPKYIGESHKDAGVASCRVFFNIPEDAASNNVYFDFIDAGGAVDSHFQIVSKINSSLNCVVTYEQVTENGTIITKPVLTHNEAAVQHNFQGETYDTPLRIVYENLAPGDYYIEISYVDIYHPTGTYVAPTGLQHWFKFLTEEDIA